MKKTFSVILILYAILTNLCLADEGRLLASQCFQCHGPNGRSKGEIDSINGKSFSELYGDLIEFKRENKIEIMHLQIKTYTDDEIRKLAAYLSTQN